MSTQRKTPPPIVAGKIELAQPRPGEVSITYKGKLGDVVLVVAAGRLERWATKIAREEAFAA